MKACVIDRVIYEMKITIFIGGISGGGAERVACNLANYLRKRGYKVSLLTMSETRNSYDLHKSIKVESLLKEDERINKVADNTKRYIRLKKYIKENSGNTFIVFLPITICLLLHFSKCIAGTIIASERNDPNQYSKIQRVALRHYAKKADKWVFQTEEARNWYGNIVKEAKVIPNAINKEFITSENHEEKKSVYTIMAAGRLNKQKNFKLLIDAFDRISSKFNNYTLKIFGKGPLEEELKKYARSKSSCDKIQFCGYVDNMPYQLANATIFVMSSDYEGMPNALMEAMASGVPCISTDCPCGGPRYLIKDHYNGLLVDVDDLCGLANAMEELLGNVNLRHFIGSNARLIVNTLSPSKIYAEWEAYIQS